MAPSFPSRSWIFGVSAVTAVVAAMLIVPLSAQAAGGLLPSGPPIGSLDSAVVGVGTTTITVGGWAIDPDVTADIAVRIYVDGAYQAEAQADQPRADVGAAYPAYGPNHGYSIALTGVAVGMHSVCAYGINAGPAGSNSTLGCRSATVRAGDPFGTLDSATVSGIRTVDVAGWAIDPDTAASISVQLYVDGTYNSTLTADGTRSDVAGAYPGYGDAHGYSATLTLAGGKHTICAYGINVLAGSNSTLGCRTATLLTGNPIGSVEVVAGVVRGVAVGGWALDPDVATSVIVQVYIDGVYADQMNAGDNRPDVASAYPGYGAAHGFSKAFGATPGTHTACFYGLNAAGTPGSSGTLGCKKVVVPSS